MRELIEEFVRELASHFDGKTVGAGGDFGATLTRGPFTISTLFHQWQDIVNPSIHVQIIHEQPVGVNLACCGGPTILQLNVRISVDQKTHGWSIAMAIYEALRSWLCEVNLTTQDATPTEDQYYLVYVDQGGIKASDVYEGDVYSKHITIDLLYLRRFE